MMKKLIILALMAIGFAACSTQPKVSVDAVRTLCEYMVRIYPQATLQDLYKTCYQDFFGPGHMVNDSVLALKYIRYEVEELRGVEDDQMIGVADEPTGFRHRFVRLDLRRIVLGEISEEEVLHRFMEAANTATPVHDNWSDEWAHIETIALQIHPEWHDEALQEALREAAKNEQAVHHSEAYRNAYHPHYRIIKNN